MPGNVDPGAYFCYNDVIPKNPRPLPLTRGFRRAFLPLTLCAACVVAAAAVNGSMRGQASNSVGISLTVVGEDVDRDAPYVEDPIPAAGATDVLTSSDIQFSLKDYEDNAGVVPGLGVDTSTIQVTVTVGANAPVTYDSSDPEFGISGVAFNRTVVINPADDFPANTLIQVTIEASDLESPPNVMTPYTYSFRTRATAAPADGTDGISGGDEPGGGRKSVPHMIDELSDGDVQTILCQRRLPDGSVVKVSIPVEEMGDDPDCVPVHPSAPLPLTHYEDVAPGVWYEEDLKALLDAKILDASQRTFRPADPAVRAEFAKVLSLLKGVTAPVVPGVPSFDDTVPGAWYDAFAEEAGRRGWMKGDDNCYGTHPCTLRPGAPATRAEAAAMIVRYYGYTELSLAPRFADVAPYAWYDDVLQIAADRCIVQGDDLTGLVAPERLVNRAEMITLFARAQQDLRYGKDCGPVSPSSAAGSTLAGSLLGRNGGAAGSAVAVAVALSAGVLHFRQKRILAQRSKI